MNTRSTGWLPVVAALAGAVVVGAIATFLIGSGPRGAGLDPSSSASVGLAPTGSAAFTAEPTPSPTATPVATPIADGPATVDWVAGDLAPDGTVRAVAWIGDRWLAVGSRLSDVAATWTSVDGLTWQPGDAVPTDGIGADVSGSGIAVVAVRDEDVLAFGWVRIGCCDQSVIWRSTDGASWSVVPTDGTEFSPPHLNVHAFPLDVTATEGGAIVLLSQPNDALRTEVVITSDLATWETNALTDDDFTWMHHVAASPMGLLGIGTRSANTAEPRAWWSDDGRTWTAVTPPSGGSMHAMAYDARSAQFVVGGADGRERPTVWLTEDGSSWTAVTLDPGPGLVQDVDARDGLIVAVGKLGTMPIPVESDPRVVAWSSYGGLDWEVVELGHHSGLPLTAVGGGTAIAVVDGSGSDNIVRVWSGTAN